MTTEYTIVEPGFEFIEPTSEYLKFLELCTRTCYKSEEHIKEGSAEKLMDKVVREYKHLSVTEHATCIMDIKSTRNVARYDDPVDTPAYRLLKILQAADPVHRQAISLFALRASFPKADTLRLSGNVRMWMELMQSDYLDVGNHIATHLHEKWPFFFDLPSEVSGPINIRVLDDNPITNQDNLSKEDMLRHMTLTCKLIGDRTFSHQLVRHRLAAYSQESQRYCDYGKKGFQFIIPPAYQGELRDEFIADVVRDYERYVHYREHGIKPEDARAKLPNATKTEVVTTYTLGIWEHIFKHRARNLKAQWQIRGIMQGIEKKFKELLPEVWNGMVL